MTQVAEGQLQPLEFDQQNISIGGEGCLPLPAFISTGPDVPTIVSCWHVTDEMIETLKQTGRLWLGVVGGHQPPVFLTVNCPIGGEETWVEEFED